MGTRSITRVKDEFGKVILTMYRQMDGYLEGHGADLVEFLSGIQLTNGIDIRQSDIKTANGMGCLAAQLVAHFKDGPGGFYIVDSNRGNDEEFIYVIELINKVLTLSYITNYETGVLFPPQLAPIEQVVEFLYPDKFGEEQWRKVSVVERDDRYITGFDLNDDRRLKRFLLEKVFGGESKVFVSNK
jgi:hypothetical protein